MTDRPIIFSAPMVRALLDGRKTQTRRLAWKPHDRDTEDMRTRVVDGRRYIKTAWQSARPGDRLWVRETWAPLAALTHNDPGCTALAAGGFYRADRSAEDHEISKWTPAIHMPRWACRITLIVEAVKMERLQDISMVDAVAEGIARNPVQNWTWIDYPEGTSAAGWDDPRQSFRSLWSSLHGPEAWAANPEVVALTFRVVKANIDSLSGAA